MGEIILKDRLGTRFITPYFKTELNRVLTECLDIYNKTNEKVTIDIQQCKFNPETHGMLTEYYKSINFIDSVNPVIDSILIHNSSVHEVVKLEQENKIKVETIPSKFDPAEIMAYLRGLDKSKVYRLQKFNELDGTSPTMSILIAMSMAYLFPSISIDLSMQAGNYFRLFAKFWMYTGEVKRDAYNLLWYGNIIKVSAIEQDASGENIFYIPGVGNINESSLNRNFEVIPYVFGTQDVRKDPELGRIYSEVCDEMQAILKKRKKTSIINILTTIDRK